jgi:hypothetical protein
MCFNKMHKYGVKNSRVFLIDTLIMPSRKCNPPRTISPPPRSETDECRTSGQKARKKRTCTSLLTPIKIRTTVQMQISWETSEKHLQLRAAVRILVPQASTNGIRSTAASRAFPSRGPARIIETHVWTCFRFLGYMSQLTGFNWKQTYCIPLSNEAKTTRSDNGSIIHCNNIDHAQCIRSNDEDIPHINLRRMPCEVSLQRSYLTCDNDQIFEQTGQ